MSNVLLRLALVAGAALPLTAACGGATDSGLIGAGPAGTVDSGNGGNPDTGSMSDGAMSQPDGAARIDANLPPPHDDAGLPPPVDASPPPKDAGSNDPGVRCGDTASATYCNVPDQICCRTDVAGQQTNMCQPASPNTCVTGLTIPCDDRQDCIDLGMSGTVCCVLSDGTGNASSVSCLKESDCVNQNGTNVCNAAGPASQCRSGTTCQPSTTTLPGYDICK